VRRRKDNVALFSSEMEIRIKLEVVEPQEALKEKRKSHTKADQPLALNIKMTKHSPKWNKILNFLNFGLFF